MRTIETRADLALLVELFYAQIRKDTVLGPIFTSHIAPVEWPAHLSKLTDFWEMHLLGGMSFTGNPTGAHSRVDESLKGQMEFSHFERWLSLWEQTLAQNFTGPTAARALDAAQRMGQGQWLAVQSRRRKN